MVFGGYSLNRLDSLRSYLIRIHFGQNKNGNAKLRSSFHVASFYIVEDVVVLSGSALTQVAAVETKSSMAASAFVDGSSL